MEKIDLASNKNKLVPYLYIKNAKKFIEFIKGAFDATEISVAYSPLGFVMNSMLSISGVVIEVSEAFSYQGSTINIFRLKVMDVDDVFYKAVAFGAESVSEPEQIYFYERQAIVKDKFNILWYISSGTDNPSNILNNY